MEYYLLKEVASYSDLRTREIDQSSYVSTENMLPNKGGITLATSVPNCQSAPKYEKGDILLSNIRPYFCKIWQATHDGSCSNDVLVLKAKEIIDPMFLYYVLSDKNFFNYDTVTSKGTKMPRGNKKAIMKYLVPKRNIKYQRRIASILSAYDDLIENNTKRIRLLEKTAENLYKEWFVRFRFPGHETTEMENSLPKGWKVVKIGDACLSIGGGTPSTSEPSYWNGDIKWVTPTDITSSNSMPLLEVKGRITEKGLVHSSAKLLPPYAILMTSRASIGYLGVNIEPVCTNQGFISVVPNKDNMLMYFLYMLKSRREEIIGNANGSTFLEISKGRFRKMEMVLPTDELLDSFQQREMQIFRMVLSLSKQNSLLARQRDLLLPRLMSGKLEVKTEI